MSLSQQTGRRSLTHTSTQCPLCHKIHLSTPDHLQNTHLNTPEQRESTSWQILQLAVGAHGRNINNSINIAVVKVHFFFTVYSECFSFLLVLIVDFLLSLINKSYLLYILYCFFVILWAYTKLVKIGLFLRVDNFVRANSKMACAMLQVSEFCLEKKV